MLNVNSWLAETTWDILALGMSSVFADLELVERLVVIVFCRNNNVVSLTVSDNGFLQNAISVMIKNRTKSDRWWSIIFSLTSSTTKLSLLVMSILAKSSWRAVAIPLLML